MQNATPILPPRNAQKLHFPPIENVAASNPLADSARANPSRFMIVEWVRCVTRWSYRNCPPSCKLPPQSYPLQMPKNSNFPLQKMWPPAIPWLTPPAQTRSLDDCEVSQVCDQAELLKLPAQLQNATSIVPPPNAQKLQFSPAENVAASNPLVDSSRPNPVA